MTQHPRHHHHTTNPPEHSPTAISGRTNRVQGGAGAGQGRAGKGCAHHTPLCKMGFVVPPQPFCERETPRPALMGVWWGMLSG